MLSEERIADALRSLPRWVREGDAVVRTVEVEGGFSGAVAFAGRLAEIADRADHHPDLAISWNRVRVAWSTHSAGGITELDLAMAAETDHLIGR